MEDWYQKCFTKLYLEEFITFDFEDESVVYIDHSIPGKYFGSFLIASIGDIKGWYVQDKLFLMSIMDCVISINLDQDTRTVEII